jgi:hypothetical protein
MKDEKTRRLQREWKRRNRERLKRKSEEWRSQNRDRVKEYQRRADLARKGTTPEALEAAFVAQGGRCAICRNTFSTGRHTHVDHDHLTGQFRGILCRDCNLGIGNFHDSIELLARATAYLSR